MNKNIIIITGAANGICKKITSELDDNKNIIYAIDSNPEITKTKDKLKKAIYIPICMDASDEESVIRLVQSIKNIYNKIDILINGAAVVPYCPIEEQNYSKFIEVIKNNLGGYMIFSKEVSKVMKERRSGIIVNISSISANFGLKGQSAYASSKGGISALTRVLAVELGEYNIRVNAVAPGSIIVKRNKKAMESKWNNEVINQNIPLGRLGTPSDVAGVVKFLISDDAKYVHGTTIVVDGGMTIKGI